MPVHICLLRKHDRGVFSSRDDYFRCAPKQLPLNLLRVIVLGKRDVSISDAVVALQRTESRDLPIRDLHRPARVDETCA